MTDMLIKERVRLLCFVKTSSFSGCKVNFLLSSGGLLRMTVWVMIDDESTHLWEH